MNIKYKKNALFYTSRQNAWSTFELRVLKSQENLSENPANSTNQTMCLTEKNYHKAFHGEGDLKFQGMLNREKNNLNFFFLGEGGFEIGIGQIFQK